MKKIRRKQLKEDKFVESVFTARVFFSRHVGLLVGIGIMAAVVITLMGLMVAYRKGMNRKASELFQQARDADAYLELYHTYTRSMVAPFALYEAARMLYADGRYEESEDNFRLFLKDFSDHLLSPSALNSIGYCLEARGRMIEAAKAYGEVAEDYKDASVVPEALINSARCYRLASRDEEAIKQYKRVINDFPGSLRSMDAERYLADLGSSSEELDRGEADG